MMKRKTLHIIALALLTALPVAGNAKTWTLDECIQYAMQHNIQIQKNKVSEEQGMVNLRQNRAALWPSLSFSTGQSMGYRPYQQSTAIVQNGQVTQTNNKVTYQGSYGLNANWTVWNGGINHKNVQAQKLQNQMTELQTEANELNIQEQIAQLYVQIMYCKEAQKVNEQLCETAQKVYDRGVEMKRQGLMAEADIAQLEAQLSNAKYDVVNSQTMVANYKRQLKSLLELKLDEDFDVQGNIPSDAAALAEIPSAQSVYSTALENRPEMKTARLNVEAADMQLDIARRGYYPTVSVTAGLGDSHYSAAHMNVGEQMKRNLNASVGMTVSVPIWDQRRNKSNVESAKLNRVTSQLDLADRERTLSSTVEQYWLQATSNQQSFRAAQAQVKSQQASYDLINSQFTNGLKNTVDLLQARDNLVNAKQNQLQSKYTTLLNMQLLRFYAGEKMSL